MGHKEKETEELFQIKGTKQTHALWDCGLDLDQKKDNGIFPNVNSIHNHSKITKTKNLKFIKHY
jgi:hypothetical protein